MEIETEEVTRYGILRRPLRALFVLLSIIGVGLAIYYHFGVSIKGAVLFEFAYNYLLIALFSVGIFLTLPARKKEKKLPWYDLLGAVLGFGISFYFFLNSWAIFEGRWLWSPGLNIIPAVILALLILEGARRAGGPVFLGVVLVLGLYPLFASYMPGMLAGRSLSFKDLIIGQIFSSNGIMGMPTKVLGEIIIPFLLFAGFLLASGAGQFFLNIAFALAGRFRGGPAKVAVIGSAFFGTLSGSAISNVVGTGCVTIPAMKRLGYPPEYAGAIEACASTGGILMPPVMGAVAFIMADFLGIEYWQVVVAAAIPAILYYFGLLMQVDAYAARVGLKGLPRQEIPSLKKTLAEGWPFIAVLLFLIWGLLYMKWEERAAIYATGILFLLSFYRKETMMTPRRLIESFKIVGTLITQTVALILPIGFILNGLLTTGTAPSFSSGLVFLGGGNMWLIILMGVLACYIMGMAGLITPAYILLAVTMAPTLIREFGLNALATHLFILYYSMLAAFTPPVAAAAFVGATIAKADPMRTSLRAARLGVVIYLVPFFFLFNPALIFQGPLLETLQTVVLAVIGILFIAAGVEGYLWKIGTIRLRERLPFLAGGFLLAIPETMTDILGAAIVLITIAVMLIKKKSRATLPSLEKEIPRNT